MYRVIRASIIYYEKHMKDSGSRYELIKPLLLLTATDKFVDAWENDTYEYKILSDIISETKSLYNTGKPIYHHFGMLLKELQILGFDVDGIIPSAITDKAMLKDEIDLLLQFMAFRYPFDKYDNKTGVHDAKTDRFIFIQP